MRQLNYLDHNATTPPLPAAVEAMRSYLLNHWGNPSSLYSFGINSKKGLDNARSQLAEFLNAGVEQVVFTSGATESINTAINSALSANPEKKHIITSEVEHSATLALCEYLEANKGYDVTRLNVDGDGNIQAADLEHAIRPDTALVSLIWANNETGVVWPISEYAEICRSSMTAFHVDAVQAVGKISVDFQKCGADYLSLSGHKFGGIKGSGALIVRSPDSFSPLIIGGKQERGHRGGTESVPLYIALGEVAHICNLRESDSWNRVSDLRDAFEADIVTRIPEAKIHGQRAARLPNTISLHLPGIDSDVAVTYLDQKDIYVSSGSACLESAIAPSHVIHAMTQSHEIASETLRISLGLNSTEAELKQLTKELLSLVEIYA